MKTVVTQFMEQAKRDPARIAVLDKQGAITYGRMNNLSAHLAERILERIGGKDHRGRIALSRFTGEKHVMVNWIFNNRLEPEAERLESFHDLYIQILEALIRKQSEI